MHPGPIQFDRVRRRPRALSPHLRLPISQLTSLIRRVSAAFPRSGVIPPELWERRHRLIVVLLWVHAVGVACLGLIQGREVGVSILQGAVIIGAAVLAGRDRWGRHVRALIATAGLLLSSAVLVHLADGFVEMHVDLFLLIVIVTLYADWLPFLLTIGYAVVEEIVIALTNPASIAEVPYFASQPWLWGGLQAGIVLAAATAGLIHWRIDEAAHGDEAAMARAAEQDRLIEAERQARATTEQALRAREELLSIVAHELKDPLGAIKGKAQLLQRQTGTREDRLRDGLELIDTSATRMAELLDVLQDVTRLATGDVPALQPEMTDVVAIARRVVAEFQKTSPPHRLRLLAPEPSLVGCWDPTRLERAIANLVLQAIMSTPAGGLVDIRVEHVASLGVPFATIAVTTDPSGLPSVLPLVSLKGVQHVASSVAPDIGIIVARQIVEQHGGYLDGPTDIAGRSVVTVRLPIQPPTRDDGCHIPVACFV